MIILIAIYVQASDYKDNKDKRKIIKIMNNKISRNQ